jgi:hypothetical protein
VLHETDLRGALKNTGPDHGSGPEQNHGAAGVSDTPSPDEDSEAAAIDPTIIGTGKDYQLVVALKRLKEMVARNAPAGRS